MSKAICLHRKRPYYDIFLLLMLVAANLGEIASVGKLKLSWLFGLCLFFVIFTLYNDDSGLFRTDNKKRYTLLFAVFWLFYGFIQFLFTFNKAYSASFFSILIINCLIIFQITLQAKNRDDILYYNKALIISLAINIVIGLWEVGTGRHLVKLEGGTDIEYYFYRAFGVFGNVNDFATFLYFGIVALFISLFYEGRHKFLYVIMILASLLLIVITSSRGALLGTLTFLVMLPISYFMIKNTNKSVLVVLFCVMILGFMILLLQYPLSDIVYKYSSSGALRSDLYRIDLIVGSLRLFVQSYMLGVGPGQSTNQLGINPHNFFLELLADYGVFVFAGIALMFLKLFFSFTKIENKKIAALNMAFVLSFIIISVSSSSANRIRATWIVISILLSLVSFEEKTDGAQIRLSTK